MSHLKRLVRAALTTSPLWELSGAVRPGGCAVLTYHRIGSNQQGFKHVSADVFRRQMQWLREHCEIVTPAEFREACDGGGRRQPRVLVTFDDGYRDYHDVAYPILQELGMAAVNFVASAYADNPHTMFWWDEVDLASWGSTRARIELPWPDMPPITLDRAGRDRLRMDIRRRVRSRPDAERETMLAAFYDALGVRPADLRIERQVMTWDEIRAVSELTTIGGHTHTHPLMSRVDEPRLRSEVSTCRDRIAAHTARPVLFAYPSGAMSETAKRVVREEGFQTAFSDERGFNDAQTDWMAARRFNAPADVGQLGYLLSGLAGRAPRTLVE